MSAHYWKTISLCSSYCITYFSNQYSSKKHYWFLLFNAYLINFNDDIVFNIHVCKLHYIERTHFILDIAKVCINNIGRFNLLPFIYSLHLNHWYIINIWWLNETCKIYCSSKIYLKFYFNDSTAMACIAAIIICFFKC